MLFSMEADLQVEKSDELFAKLQSQHGKVTSMSQEGL